ncbi:Phosphatidylglycerol/phosphatidylinositol transfer protein [Golovinomyces cichoracearum]|uniref:Phosphatidylglycerol/phosphatidylinositol transfer protein n=1 Tax=Golovinomyces cichoracearum TaxID=62708 RepID=A0A420JAF2_9PEZI|nr:Phosphatidylglycerol/phosphatidylinositol transfer protein [Golovinomyces cichoracearum]
MKFFYGSVVSTLITGAVCLVVEPFVSSSPQVAPQKILDDVVYSVPGDISLKYCSGHQEGQLLKISEATVNPNPAQKGKILNIDIVGQLPEKVEGGYVDVVVKIGLIKILQHTIDLCDDDSIAKITCPLEKGPVKLHSEIEIPEQVPPALFHVHAQAYTNNDEYLFCLESNANFRHSLPRD